jgi:hypothetical protein
MKIRGETETETETKRQRERWLTCHSGQAIGKASNECIEIHLDAVCGVNDVYPFANGLADRKVGQALRRSDLRR